MNESRIPIENYKKFLAAMYSAPRSITPRMAKSPSGNGIVVPCGGVDAMQVHPQCEPAIHRAGDSDGMEAVLAELASKCGGELSFLRSAFEHR